MSNYANKEFFTHSSKIQPEHDYDQPSLSPLQFIQAVMHDPHTPLHIRLKAARTKASQDPHQGTSPMGEPALAPFIGGG
jgi:hypothetical protein